MAPEWLRISRRLPEEEAATQWRRSTHSTAATYFEKLTMMRIISMVNIAKKCMMTTTANAVPASTRTHLLRPIFAAECQSPIADGA